MAQLDERELGVVVEDGVDKNALDIMLGQMGLILKDRAKAINAVCEIAELYEPNDFTVFIDNSENSEVLPLFASGEESRLYHRPDHNIRIQVGVV